MKKFLTLTEAVREASRIGFKIDTQMLTAMAKADDIDFKMTKGEYKIPAYEIERLGFQHENTALRTGKAAYSIAKQIRLDY